MGDGMVTGPMIEAEGLAKRYGQTLALAGVGFAVPAGTILGLLGPNGAGKTTAVRILTTLALPDAGRAAVAGIDVVRHPGQVRRYIGVVGQEATLDPLLSGRQNLLIVGELSGIGRAASRARAAELLAQFDLADAADRVLKGYSGGMRRRLDLAARAWERSRPAARSRFRAPGQAQPAATRVRTARPKPASARQASRRQNLRRDPASVGATGTAGSDRGCQHAWRSTHSRCPGCDHYRSRCAGFWLG
jgi:ABC-type transport system involved in cytochrome c biogenesis ATPase subunit